MKTAPINLKDFDLERFLIGRPLELNSGEIDILRNACDHLARFRQRICLITPPGTGVENFWVRYKNENPEQIFVLSCSNGSVEKVFGHLMIELGFGHKQVNWFDTPVENIVQALIYYLDKINNRTLLVFDNCDSLTIPKLCELLGKLLRMKNQTGILFRITPSFADRIKKSSNSEIRHYITQFDVLEIKYSEPAELLKAVQENGIVSKGVAEGIIKDTLDFDLICRRVETLRLEVKAFLENSTKS